MNIIKNNPFRILGILVGTSTKEEHAKARKIKMSVDALKVGKVNYNYNVKK